MLRGLPPALRTPGLSALPRPKTQRAAAEEEEEEEDEGGTLRGAAEEVGVFTAHNPPYQHHRWLFVLQTTANTNEGNQSEGE